MSGVVHLLGVLLAANALVTGPFWHLHHHEHSAPLPHWHIDLSGEEGSLLPAEDHDDAVDANPSIQKIAPPAMPALSSAYGGVRPDNSYRPVSQTPEPRSHDPPRDGPSVPRAPPA